MAIVEGQKVLSMVLAGGQGKRLHPLTADRAKPAVPFGGEYRIIDFILNNFVNSGLHSIFVLTQFKAQSLTEHIQRYWRFGTFLSDHFITLAPAQMYRYEELGPVWYRGTASCCLYVHSCSSSMISRPRSGCGAKTALREPTTTP